MKSIEFTNQGRGKIAKSATKAEKQWMDKVSQIGCIICGSPAEIHHCGTYMGGGRNHMNVLPLCHEHHRGPQGIDGKKIAKRIWEAKYGTEEQLMEKVKKVIMEMIK